MERSGCWLLPLTNQLNISIDDVQYRINKLEENKVIANYKATVFIPPFLGGDWVWGCILANAKHREKSIEQILNKIPFISEIWLNSNLPTHIGHNFSLIFYSKDFATELRFIKELSDISNLAAYRISNYSFPMARIFSSEEIILLKNIFLNPMLTDDDLAEVCHKTITWIRTKKEKLVWNPENPNGVIYVLPEIQYNQIENFSHCHFIIEYSGNLELLLSELKISGFDLVLHGNSLHSSDPTTQRYAQLEIEIWGFNDLVNKKAHLDSFKEIKILGIVFAEKMLVVSNWGINLLKS